MKKIWCWFVTGLLLLSPTLVASANYHPRIITVNGGWQLGASYYNSFGSNSFFTQACENPTTIQGIPAWGGTSYIRLGDFNGNGSLDIASPHAGWVLIKTTDQSTIYLDGTWCLQHLAPTPVANNWGTAAYTWVGDFNGDRKDDIASAAGGSVFMKLSNGGSGFTGFTSSTWAVPNIPIPYAPWTGALWGGSDYTWVGDFDGDNKDDIASAVGSSVRVHLSRGNRFESYTWNVTNPWAVSAWTRVGDFNGDNKDDIASADGGTVYMNLSTGSGFDSRTWPVTGGWGGAGYTWVADFDRNGRADFASADAAAGVVHMKLSTGTQFNCVDWQAPNLPDSSKWGGSQYTWVMDYDSDGYKDIVTAYNSFTLVTRRNTDGTNFEPASWDFFGWWGPAENTWALNYSRFSFLSP